MDNKEQIERKNAIVQYMQMLFTTWGYTNSEIHIQTWYFALEGIPVEKIRTAVLRVLKERTKSSVIVPAEIIQAIKEEDAFVQELLKQYMNELEASGVIHDTWNHSENKHEISEEWTYLVYKKKEEIYSNRGWRMEEIEPSKPKKRIEPYKKASLDVVNAILDKILAKKSVDK